MGKQGHRRPSAPPQSLRRRKVGRAARAIYLLAAARLEAMLAKTRFDIAKAQADDVSIKARASAAGEESFAAAVAELRDMEARRNATGLNIEEISASGHAPHDDLGAPLVGGRGRSRLFHCGAAHY